MSIATVNVWQRAPSAGKPTYWRNSWEIDLGVAGFLNDMEPIATAFANFHRSVLVGDYFVDHVTISTYEPESNRYDPDNFYVLPLNVRGLGNREGNMLPLSVVLNVRKLTPRGRNGRLVLRGRLQTGDILSDESGVPYLNGVEGFQTTLNNSWSALNTALGSYSVVLASGNGPDVRTVLGLAVGEVGTNRLSRARASRIPASSPFTQMAEALGDLANVADLVNPIITAYNALPLADIPLLPGP